MLSFNSIAVTDKNYTTFFKPYRNIDGKLSVLGYTFRQIFDGKVSLLGHTFVRGIFPLFYMTNHIPNS